MEVDDDEQVLATRVMERDVSAVQSITLPGTSHPDAAFPTVQKIASDQMRNLSNSSVEGTKRMSIFARQQQKQQQETLSSVEQNQEHIPAAYSSHHGKQDEETGCGVNVDSIEGQTPHFLASLPTSEQSKIHLENMDRLRSLREDEILRERDLLMSHLTRSNIDINKVLENINKSRARNQGSDSSEPESSGLLPTLSGQPAGSLSSSAAEMAGAIPSTAASTANAAYSDSLPNAGDWLHMDVVEPDKLEWIRDLPLPDAGAEAKGESGARSVSVRFDFRGHIVTGTTDVPVTMGLHHHGQEPHAAGYTLSELFHLTRSSLPAQRVIALNTLAAIFHCANSGAYAAYKLEPPVLSSLNEMGVIFLLRYAIDDKSTTVMSSAITALHHYLVSDTDEMLSDYMFTAKCNINATSASNVIFLTPDTSAEEEKASESEGVHPHVTITNSDVMKGLLEMNILARLRYVLRVCKMDYECVTNILQILCRICRHSLHSASQVLEFPHLLDTICTQFMPLEWTLSTDHTSTHTPYGSPHVHAVRLLRLICQCGPGCTNTLMKRYNLEERIERYVSAHSISTQMYTEMLRLWTVISEHNMGAKIYTDLRPILIESLVSISRSVSLDSGGVSQDSGAVSQDSGAVSQDSSAVSQDSSAVSQDNSAVSQDSSQQASVRITTFISLLETITRSTRHHQTLHGSLNLLDVVALVEPVKLCCVKWLSQLVDAVVSTSDQLPSHPPHTNILSAVLDYMSTYYTVYKNLDTGYNPIDLIKDTEQFYNRLMQPLTTKSSQLISKLFSNVSSYSLVRHADRTNESNGSSRTNQSNLPRLATDDNHWEMLEKSYVTLLLSLIRFLYTVIQCGHNETVGQYVLSVFGNEGCEHYMRSHVMRGRPEGEGEGESWESGWLMRTEIYLLYYIIHIHHRYQMKVSDVWQLSMKLVEYVGAGDEALLSYLINYVIMDKELLLCSGGGDHSADSLLSDCWDHVPHMCTCYTHCFNLPAPSPSLHSPHSPHRGLKHSANAILPRDWVYAPINKLYLLYTNMCEKQSSQLASGDGDAPVVDVKLSEGHVSVVINCLRFVYSLSVYHRDVILYDQHSYTLRYVRIMLIFLIGETMFLESGVDLYLHGLLLDIIKHQDKLDFTLTLPGLSSFHDFYLNVLAHYEAYSYSDPVFTHYILIPLQQRHRAAYRRSVWFDHLQILRLVQIKVEQLEFDVDSLLYPLETGVELVHSYMSALVSRRIQASHQPIPYLVALHHLHHFLNQPQSAHDSSATHQDLVDDIIKTTGALTNETLKEHLLTYKHGVTLS